MSSHFLCWDFLVRRVIWMIDTIPCRVRESPYQVVHNQPLVQILNITGVYTSWLPPGPKRIKKIVVIWLIDTLQCRLLRACPYLVVHHPSSIILVYFPLNITASYFTVNCFEIQKLYILVYLMMKITFQYLIQFWGSDFCSINDHWALELYQSCCKWQG